MEKSYENAKASFEKKSLSEEESILETHVGEQIEKLKNREGIISSRGLYKLFL